MSEPLTTTHNDGWDLGEPNVVIDELPGFVATREELVVLYRYWFREYEAAILNMACENHGERGLEWGLFSLWRRAGIAEFITPADEAQVFVEELVLMWGDRDPAALVNQGAARAILDSVPEECREACTTGPHDACREAICLTWFLEFHEVVLEAVAANIRWRRSISCVRDALLPLDEAAHRNYREAEKERELTFRALVDHLAHRPKGDVGWLSRARPIGSRSSR